MTDYKTVHAVFVTVDVRTECIDEFTKITEYNAANARLEAGNIRFDLLQSKDDPTKFTLYEVYVDADAAARHKTTEHYLKWRDTVAPMMASPRVPSPQYAVIV